MSDFIQRYQDLQLAIKEWIRFGRKGTMPRKVRANSNVTKKVSRSLRVKRDRSKREVTKQIQRLRANKGRNVRTGK